MRIALAALSAALVSVPAFGKDPDQSWTEWRAMKRCAQHRPVSCIHRAALHRHVSFPWLKAVAYCESKFQVYARNPSGAAGLFQFMPSTFARTPYGWAWLYSAKYQALAAAWMFANGRSSEWTCA